MTDEATALISRAGRAVVRSGETYHVLTADDPETRPADATHWLHLRGLHPDSALMPADAHPFPAVRARMIEAWREQLGLDLLLLCLDREHDDDFRRETCAVLEDLLGKVPWLRDRLRAILFSAEVPPVADLEGARALAAVAGAKQVEQLAGEMIEAQQDVAAVLAAWQGAVKSLATPAEWTEATAAATRLRAMARAVVALRSQSPGAWEEHRAWCAAQLEPALGAITAEGAALIERWLTALEKERGLARARLAAESPDALARLIRERLSVRRRGDIDADLGAQLGRLASYGEASAAEAAELLRRVDLGARDRVLDAAAREHLRLAGSVRLLVEALLHTIGGLGNIRPLRDPPSAEEQRWAGLSARRLAVATPELQARIDLLLVPEPAAAKRTIKAPAWVPGRCVTA